MNPKKTARFIALFALFILLANAAYSVKVSRTYIEVRVDKDGYATVTENYWVIFENAKDKQLFDEAKQRNGSTVSSWKSDYEWLYPKFGDIVGSEPSIKKSSITFDESEKKIVLYYELAKPFAVLVNDEPRVSLWSIPDSAFYKFVSNDLIKIEENTLITIILPEGSIVDRSLISGLAKINNNKIELGALSTNSIKINYEIRKPISSREFSIASILENPLLAIFFVLALSILLALGIINRKQIKESLEEYIVKHTELEKNMKEEEELEV